ncbi:hypothetical protein Tco_0187252 [Tanacetum coccineum]
MIISNTPFSSSFINQYQHLWHPLELPFPMFVDLNHDDTKTPSPTLQLSSPSAPNAPSKTPSGDPFLTDLT